MDPKLRRKLIVSGTGVLVLIGLLVAAYIFYLGPRFKAWREARQEVTSREKRLNELRKLFGNQNPQDEIKALQQEIISLTIANEKLQKIKTIGRESEDLPKELWDPNPDIRRELYKEYLKSVMAADEKNLKQKFTDAKILPPDLKLYQDLENPDEVAYYMNRAGGLQGLTNALAESRSGDGKLIIDKIELEDYTEGTGIKRREGAVNIMSYLLKMTLDTQTLVSFLYNLHEQDAFYYVEHLEMKPKPTTRGGLQELGVEARINTTMIFKSKVEAQVKAAIAEAGKTTTSGGGGTGGGGWMSQLAVSMKKDMEASKGKPEKKWYQFWKWFSKE